MLRFCPRRLLVFMALALGAGIFMGKSVPFSLLWGIPVLLSFTLAFLFHKEKASPFLPLMAGMALTGVLLSSWTFHRELPEAGNYIVTATVDGDLKIREADGRVSGYLKNITLNGADTAGKAYWSYYPEEGEGVPETGDRVTFTARLYHPGGQSNPHGFDFRLFLLQKNVLFCFSGAKEMTIEYKNGGTALDRIRTSLKKKLNLYLEDSSLAQTLLLNDKTEMPEDVTEDFRRAGIAHVLSVSGLHVMILLSALMLLLRRFPLPQYALLGIFTLFLVPYCLLVGLTPAIVRAVIIVLLQYLGRSMRRKTDGLTSLAAAFILILLVRPAQLFAAGFQMSFCAVAGMIMLGDRLESLLSHVHGKRLRSILSAYGITLCASLGVALPVIYQFHQVSLVGLIINPLIAPLISLLIPLYLLLLLIGVLSPAAAVFCGKGISVLTGWLTAGLHALSSIPWAVVNVPSPPWYMTAAIVLCLFLCTRYTVLKKRRRVLLGFSAAAASVLIMIFTRCTEVRYIQFSMGSADAAVIEDGDDTIVIDTGKSGDDLASYLLSEGRQANKVILTHLHVDHAQGLMDLLEADVPIGTVYISTECEKSVLNDTVREVLEAVKERNIPIEKLSKGDELSTKRVHISVLWPEEGMAAENDDANNWALTMMINLDGTRMLQMSDVGQTYEMASAEGADILKIAHHGSASATRERFLKIVSPRVGILSSSGSSSAKTLERLAQSAVSVYDTSVCGAVTVTAKDGEFTVERFIQ